MTDQQYRDEATKKNNEFNQEQKVLSCSMKEDPCCGESLEKKSRGIIECYISVADTFSNDMRILNDMLPSKLSYEQDAALQRILSLLRCMQSNI